MKGADVMADGVLLYAPMSDDAQRVADLIAAQVKVNNQEFYLDSKVAIKGVIDAAAQGENVILAVPSGEYCAVKLALLKGLSVRILRSSKISAQIGDKIPADSREYNIQTAIPEDSETFVSADGLYSAIACKSLKGTVVIMPSDEYRLQEAIDAGAVKAAVPAKTSKAQLAESINSIVASGKKIAVADFGKSVALLTAVNAVAPEQTTFTPVTALTDVKYGARDFEASLAKEAKDSGAFDYGVVVSDLSDKGVTIAVSDSHTARVEILQAQPGEDAKKLMANAVVRICEMTKEAAEDGINMPKSSISAMSKTGFWAIAGGLMLGILLCIVICVMLFTRADKRMAEADNTSTAEMTGAEMGELLTSDVPISSTVLTTIETSLEDLFDDYTTYVGGNSANGVNTNFTTSPVDYNDAAFDTTATEDAGGVTRPNAQSDNLEKMTTLTSSETQAPKGKFVFTVYGWGHGAGLSQDGAIALAKQGKSCNQILCHYYPGVTLMVDKNTPMYTEEPNAEGKGGETLLSFLCQTVKQEIGDGAPYEALKAQAVCAYTYAMNHRNFGAGQTMDRNFKYQGTNVERAVMDVLHITSAEQQPHCTYISYNGTYANAVYYSNCAGTTTSSVNAWGGARVPYLCGGIDSPENVMISTYEVTAEKMQNLIKSYVGGSVKFDKNPARWIKILNHDGAYNNGTGYIGQIDMCGTVLSGNQFRTKVMGGALKSHCFTIQYVTE